ncbi:hypothetical protein JX266_008809 [Neoarthrinium moseri]|nr:hypothetical protein JX266_008809 [Neoarthrinium moseri]
MSVPYDLPAPKRITASNLPLPAPAASDETAEPGVEVKIDTLVPESIMGGLYHKTSVATAKKVPTSNDGL